MLLESTPAVLRTQCRNSNPGNLSTPGAAAWLCRRTEFAASFLQPVEKLRPKLIRLGDSWFLRFDGEDDHLRLLDVEAFGIRQPAESRDDFLVVNAAHSNAGNFRGLFAANAPERRDYESGLCIDLGPGPSLKSDQLNVEGPDSAGPEIW
jgi:hypothetical protein